MMFIGKPLSNRFTRSTLVVGIFVVGMTVSAVGIAGEGPDCFDGTTEDLSNLSDRSLPTGGEKSDVRSCIFRSRDRPGPISPNYDSANNSFTVTVEVENRCGGEEPITAYFVQSLYGCTGSGENKDCNTNFKSGQRVKVDINPDSKTEVSLTFDLADLCGADDACENVPYQWDFDIMIPNIAGALHPSKVDFSDFGTCNPNDPNITHDTRTQCWHNAIYGRQGGTAKTDGIDGTPCGGTFGEDTRTYTRADSANAGGGNDTQPVTDVNNTDEVVEQLAAAATAAMVEADKQASIAEVAAVEAASAADVTAANTAVSEAKDAAFKARNAATLARAKANDNTNTAAADSTHAAAEAAEAFADAAEASAAAAATSASALAAAGPAGGSNCASEGRCVSGVGLGPAEAPSLTESSNNLGSSGCGGADLSDGTQSLSLLALMLLACLGITRRAFQS